MPISEAQKRAKAKYREKTYCLQVTFFPKDEELLRRLEEIDAEGEARASYVKRLIREDIERNKKQQ